MIKTEAYNESTQFLGLTTKNGFKAGKLYTQKPLSAADAFVVDRNLAAYRINQSGVLELMAANVPRIDYTNTCPELLIEKSSTNLLLRSQEFNNASWTKGDVTITANSITAPDGSMTADTLTGNIGTAFKYIYQSIPIFNNGHICSFYVKKGTQRYIQILLSGIGEYANYDLQDLVTNKYGGAIDSNIIEYNNNWLRIDISINQPSNSDGPFLCFVDSLVAGRASSTASTGTIYIWGAQLEEGSYLTSYIPTTTTIVTRPPDIIENNTINYDINQATIFVRARLDFSTNTRGIITLYDGAAFENYITIYSEIIGAVRKIVFQTYTDPDENKYELTVPSNGIYNMAFAYDLTANTYAIAVNGNIEFSGTFAISPPTSSELNTLTLGRIGSFYDARVIGSMFFDSKLDNTSLENLTA